MALTRINTSQVDLKWVSLTFLDSFQAADYGAVDRWILDIWNPKNIGF